MTDQLCEQCGALYTGRHYCPRPELPQDRRTEGNKYHYAVTGDFSRLVYSRHVAREHAESACRKLARKWSNSHPGSEPRVVAIPVHDPRATHIR